MRFALACTLLVCAAACGQKDAPPLPVSHDAAVGRSEPPPVTIDAGDPRVAQGAELYGKLCALCHGPEAKGYIADNAPSLVSEQFLKSASDDFLVMGIALGRPGTAMAAYSKDKGGPLDMAGIRAIVAWLRSRGPARGPVAGTPGRGDAARAAPVYAEKCASCHGTREQRGAAVHLANPVFLSTSTDAFLRHAIAEGRPGAGAPPLQMVPWKEQLTAEQIDDLVALLRSWAPANAPTMGGPPPKEPPKTGPVVINPKGSAPKFTLREDRFVPVDDVKAAVDRKQRIVVVDARPASDWIRGHIPGSISIPYHQMDRIKDLPNDGTWIITYCACPHHASGIVLDELRKRGFTHTAILDEGVLVWQKRGYPVEEWK